MKIVALHSLIQILFGIKRYFPESQDVPHLFPSTSRIKFPDEQSSIHSPLLSWIGHIL